MKINNVKFDGDWLVICLSDGSSECLKYEKHSETIKAWKFYSAKIGLDYVRPTTKEKAE